MVMVLMDHYEKQGGFAIPSFFFESRWYDQVTLGDPGTSTLTEFGRSSQREKEEAEKDLLEALEP